MASYILVGIATVVGILVEKLWLNNSSPKRAGVEM
jgi:hypothetical protein